MESIFYYGALKFDFGTEAWLLGRVGASLKYQSTGEGVAFEEKIWHFEPPPLIHMANFRSPRWYNSHGDKHVGLNVSREYDKPFSIPFHAAWHSFRTAFAPLVGSKHSRARWQR